MASAPPAAFERDLGYLDGFFSKLEAHAAGLEPAARARLEALLAEERARWVEIRGLLAGAAPGPSAPVGPKAAPAVAAGRERPRLTVGSLIAGKGGPDPV